MKLSRNGKIYLIGLCAGLLFVLIGLIGGHIQERKVKIGQVWVWESSPNPFEPISREENLILNIKKGVDGNLYVKYEDLLTGEVESSSVRWFLIGSKLKEDSD